jgi:hypothetical protein
VVRSLALNLTLAAADRQAVPAPGIGQHMSQWCEMGLCGLPVDAMMAVMLPNKARKELDKTIYARVKKEMAKPAIARSARITELDLDTARFLDLPGITLPGTVDKIIPPAHPGQTEKAQIAFDGAAHQHRELRIENTLTDQHGNPVSLKKGARVAVTVRRKNKLKGHS